MDEKFTTQQELMLEELRSLHSRVDVSTDRLTQKLFKILETVSIILAVLAVFGNFPSGWEALVYIFPSIAIAFIVIFSMWPRKVGLPLKPDWEGTIWPKFIDKPVKDAFSAMVSGYLDAIKRIEVKNNILIKLLITALIFLIAQFLVIIFVTATR